MSISPSEDVPEDVADVFVIDHDIHFGPDSEALRPYIGDDVVRGELKKIAEHSFSSARGHPQNTKTLHPELASSGDVSDVVGYIQTGEDVVEAAERMGVDIPVVAPELFYLSSSSYPVLVGAIVRAYNDIVLDRIVTADEDVKAWALLPQWDVDATVAELDRVGDETDIVGAYAFFEHVHKAFGSRQFDPVFEKLVELDLPLAIHGGRLTRKGSPDAESVRTFSEGMGIHWTCNAMIYMANMINTGVFDKFPDLQILIQEPGFTWVPFFAQHLDAMVETYPEDIKVTPRMHEMGKEYLDKKPSEYVFDNFYFDTQPFSLTGDESHGRALLEMCQADKRLTFSSDWPHPSMDMPWEVSDHPAIDENLREKILGRNARQFLRL